MRLRDLTAIAAVALALASCSAQTIKTAKATTTPSSVFDTLSPLPSDEETPPPSVPTSTVPYGLGDVIHLHGQDDGELVDVTLLSFAGNVRSSDEFCTPDAGMRYFAVEIRLKNVGTAVYDDAPSNGAVLVDSGDHQYSDTALCGEKKPDIGSPKIGPGDSRVGWMTFQVGKSAVIKKFQFTLDSGYADESGEWVFRKT
jgi:hypothetical protein